MQTHAERRRKETVIICHDKKYIQNVAMLVDERKIFLHNMMAAKKHATKELKASSH